jgi:hypothetical protein
MVHISHEVNKQIELKLNLLKKGEEGMTKSYPFQLKGRQHLLLTVEDFDNED